MQMMYGNHAVSQLLRQSRTESSGEQVIQGKLTVPAKQAKKKSEKKLEELRAAQAKKVRGYNVYANGEPHEQAMMEEWFREDTPAVDLWLADSFKKELAQLNAKLPLAYLKHWSLDAMQKRLDSMEFSQDEAYANLVQEIKNRSGTSMKKLDMHALGIDRLRKVDESQPKGTSSQATDTKPVTISSAPKKDWKQVDKKAAPRSELMELADSANHMVNSNEELMCVCCRNYFPKPQFHVDHQIPFEQLKDKVKKLAHYATMDNDVLSHLKTVYDKKFNEYFAENNGIVSPTQGMVDDYSNDVKNLLLICGNCNSFGGKGTETVEGFFKRVPFFGQEFIDYAKQGGGDGEFFGNPSLTEGWGAKAREWIKHMIQTMESIASMHKREEKMFRAARKVDKEKLDASKLTGKDGEEQKKKTLKRGRAVSVALKAPDKLQDQLLEIEEVEDYSDHSDEESLVDRVATAGRDVMDSRKLRKVKKQDAYQRMYRQYLDSELEKEIQEGNHDYEYRAEAFEDAVQRREQLKLASYLLALDDKEGALKAAGVLSEVENKRVQEQCKFVVDQIRVIGEHAKECGKKDQDMPETAGLYAKYPQVEILLYKLIIARYNEGCRERRAEAANKTKQQEESEKPTSGESMLITNEQ